MGTERGRKIGAGPGMALIAANQAVRLILNALL
jgi:hypothetical protein